MDAPLPALVGLVSHIRHKTMTSVASVYMAQRLQSEARSAPFVACDGVISFARFVLQCVPF